MEERAANSALLRAAQYVRMSTEHQQYSTENQSEAIARYAKAHGMEIDRMVAATQDECQYGTVWRRNSLLRSGYGGLTRSRPCDGYPGIIPGQKSCWGKLKHTPRDLETLSLGCSRRCWPPVQDG
jgi:hypothetical protein